MKNLVAAQVPRYDMKKNHVFYVSQTGNDKWSGTLAVPGKLLKDGPFATLERARSAVRKLLKKNVAGKITVYIRGGNYYLDKPFLLGSADSGSPKNPVEWRAFRREQVRLIGGVRINDLKRHDNKIMVADLARAGIGVIDEYPAMSWNVSCASQVPNAELFCNSKPMPPACWPKEKSGMRVPQVRGWACTGAVPEEGSKTRFTCRALRRKAWKHPEDARIHIFPDFDWADDVRGIAAFDPESGTVTLKSDTTYALKPGRRFRVLNVFEELTEKGEWFLDRRERKIYFIPPGAFDPGDLASPVNEVVREKRAFSKKNSCSCRINRQGACHNENPGSLDGVELVLSTLDSVLRMESVRHLTVSGLTIECCRGTAVKISKSIKCCITGCVIRNAGASGIELNSGTGNRVSGCDLYDLGRGGVILSGGDRRTLEPAGNVAENCHIHHYGRLVKCYCAGININGVGNRIAHCEIHDAPHSAIILHGNDHVIEYNRMHHVLQESSDAGAFYMGRDWTEQGNVIRYNMFHDLAGLNSAGSRIVDGVIEYVSPANVCAIYLDDCASGVHIYGNIFYRVPLLALHAAGGKDNCFENNVVVGSNPPVVFCWRSPSMMYNTIIQRYMKTAYGNAVYEKRYPHLKKYLMGKMQLPERAVARRNVFVYGDDDFYGPWHPKTGKGIAAVYDLVHWDHESAVIDENLIWHEGKPVRVSFSNVGAKKKTVDWAEWLKMGFDKRSRIADPMFVDPVSDNYQLKKASPAYKKGFKTIPVERIGLYKSPHRATWPVAIERAPMLKGVRRARIAFDK